MKFSDYLKEGKEMKIYCDMDGVLCDFDKGILEIDGITTVDDLIEGDPVLDMWVHIDKVGGCEEFYKNLDWLPDGEILWDYLKTMKNVEILSSLGGSNPDMEGAKKGKIAWLKKNKIDIPQHFAEGAKFKQKWANPNAILIDDYERNIDQWRKAGGIAIYFINANNAINELKECLK